MQRITYICLRMTWYMELGTILYVACHGTQENVFFWISRAYPILQRSLAAPGLIARCKDWIPDDTDLRVKQEFSVLWQETSSIRT